jgi:ABC-type transporter Mla maintaining outer membrane lipid asymmetry permease subunit MlaE
MRASALYALLLRLQSYDVKFLMVGAQTSSVDGLAMQLLRQLGPVLGESIDGAALFHVGGVHPYGLL